MDSTIDSDCRIFVAEHPGTEPIDYFLAKELVTLLDVEAPDAGKTRLLFFSIVAVSSALRNGHSCLLLEAWAGARQWFESRERSEKPDSAYKPAEPAIETLGFEFPQLEAWLEYLQGFGFEPENNHPLVLENNRLYLRRYRQFEKESAQQIHHLTNAPVDYDPDRAKAILDRLFPESDLYNETQPQRIEAPEPDQQKVAVANALGKRFCIVAGGPGTGKTTTVTKLLSTLIELTSQSTQQPIIKLTAPTGKAAQRLTESIRKAKNSMRDDDLISAAVLDTIPEQAGTIHRLLGVIPESNEFRHNRDNPLNLDILLVDEASMVDLPLMTRLFRALPEQARVILLGDPDQLPSVAAGSVLYDLAPNPHPGYSDKNAQILEALTGHRVPVADKKPTDYLTLLTKSYRFKASGGIGNLARQVIAGQSESSWAQLEQGNEEITLIQNNIFLNRLNQLTRQYYLPVMLSQTVEEALKNLNKFRILAATRIGEKGVEMLNLQIEHILRLSGHIWTKSALYKGRPIMVTQNHYGLGLYNGDVGLIWERNGRLQAAFPLTDGEIRWLSLGRLPQIESVYAMTIHKTQGSEFDNVALIIPDQHNRVLSRQLIYTGITRAKSSIEICSGKDVWIRGVNQRIVRDSGLADRL